MLQNGLGASFDWLLLCYTPFQIGVRNSNSKNGIQETSLHYYSS